MTIGKLFNRTVVSAPAYMTVAEASLVMREQHVGDILVVEQRAAGRRPIGIVTDRDIVVNVVAAGLEPGLVTLADLLLGPLATINEHDRYAETIERMMVTGVRNVPVGDDNALLGGITLDDLLPQLATHTAPLTQFPVWRANVDRAGDLEESDAVDT